MKKKGIPVDNKKEYNQPYIIYESELKIWQVLQPMSPMAQEIRQNVRDRPTLDTEVKQ